MAPLQIEQEKSLEQGYTHKKFNCGYSHKKLGLYLKQRDQENKENVSQLQQDQNEQVKIKKTSKDLFRPYALGDDTPRKRKIARYSQKNYTTNFDTPQTSPILHSPVSYNLQYNYQSAIPMTTLSSTTIQTCASSALSPDLYAIGLQRQRFALYMHYISQFQQIPTFPAEAITNLQTATGYPMGYPNVTVPIYNYY